MIGIYCFRMRSTAGELVFLELMCALLLCCAVGCESRSAGKSVYTRTKTVIQRQYSDMPCFARKLYQTSGSENSQWTKDYNCVQNLHSWDNAAAALPWHACTFRVVRQEVGSRSIVTTLTEYSVLGKIIEVIPQVKYKLINMLCSFSAPVTGHNDNSLTLRGTGPGI